MGKDKENKRIAESKMRYNQFVTSKSLARKGGTRGITLIALVITIIVLLILAAISISALKGDNGIITEANEAKRKTEEANVKEMVEVEILKEQVKSRSGNLTTEELREILDQYFKDVPAKAEDLQKNLEDPEYKLKARDEYGKDIELKVSDLYGGDLTLGTVDDDPRPDADLEVSYVGYYADFEDEDGNKTPDGKPDGVIYADLAVKKEGKWGNDSDSIYSYGYETEEDKAKLKKYKISEEKVTGFGTWEEKMITPANGTSGEDRFYVMALKDLDEDYHYWYYNAYGNLDNSVEGSRNDFGEGKANTTDMIEKYKNGTYGEPYEGGSYTDLWGLDSLKEKATKGWFVPSKSEWSAFGDLFNPDIENGFYQKDLIIDYYWSSSQRDNYSAWSAYFNGIYVDIDSVDSGCYVRLSATF